MMTRGFSYLLKWFAYAAITLLICLIVIVPLGLFAEYFIDSLGVNSLVENIIFWIIGLFGLFAGIGIAARLGFDVFSVPFGKINGDVE